MVDTHVEHERVSSWTLRFAVQGERSMIYVLSSTSHVDPMTKLWFATAVSRRGSLFSLLSCIPEGPVGYCSYRSPEMVGRLR